MKNELSRIEDYVSGEIPSGSLYAVFTMKDNEEGENLRRAKDVMRIIARYSEDDWPEFDVWLTLLPSWFLNRFQTLAQAELRGAGRLGNNSWRWLEGMSERDWEWWSSQDLGDQFKVCLSVSEAPNNLFLFKEFMGVCKADITEEIP